MTATKKRHKEIIWDSEYSKRSELVTFIKLHKESGDYARLATLYGVPSTYISRIVQNGTLERLEQIAEGIKKLRGAK
jgi:hypothetical protein